MPTYAYKCQNCKHELEAFQKIIDAPLTQCPQCDQASLKRGPGGGIGTVFSGSGWYKDNYGSSAAPSSKDGGGCCPCGKSEGSCKS